MSIDGTIPSRSQTEHGHFTSARTVGETGLGRGPIARHGRRSAGSLASRARRHIGAGRKVAINRRRVRRSNRVRFVVDIRACRRAWQFLLQPPSDARGS